MFGFRGFGMPGARVRAKKAKKKEKGKELDARTRWLLKHKEVRFYIKKDEYELLEKLASARNMTVKDYVISVAKELISVGEELKKLEEKAKELRIREAVLNEEEDKLQRRRKELEEKEKELEKMEERIEAKLIRAEAKSVREAMELTRILDAWKREKAKRWMLYGSDLI